MLKIELSKRDGVWIGAIKLFFKALIGVVGCIFLFVAACFYISPKTDAKIFNFFGLSKAEEQCYIRIYQRSGATSDLYNLVIFEMNAGNYSLEREYIEALLAAEDYETFVAKLDASAVVSANGNKYLYAHVADTHAFLKSQLVKCIFWVGADEVADGWTDSLMELALESLQGEYLTDNSFATLMNLVYSSELSESEKSSLAAKIMNSVSAESFSQAISDKVLLLESAFDEESDEVQKILLKYAEAQVYYGAYYQELCYYGVATTKSVEYKSLYTAAYQEYLALCEA